MYAWSLRSISLLLLVFAALLLPNKVSVPPAHADWYAGCGPLYSPCPTIQALCEFTAQQMNPSAYCLSIGPPKYSGPYPGLMVGMSYQVMWGLPFHEFGTIECPDGQYIDGLAPNGCSQFQWQNPKQFGNTCPGTCPVGDPFSVATGNLFEAATDLGTEGPDKLAFIRYYNSQSQRFSLLGFKWRSNFDSTLDFFGQPANTASKIMVIRPDGAEYQFNLSNGAWSANDTDVDGTLTTDNATEWTFVDHNNVTYTYDYTTGNLESITDLSGYKQSLSYDPSGNGITVSDTLGRRLTLNLTNGVVTSVVDPGNNTYAYAYNTLTYCTGYGDQLYQVTYPDETSVTYKYENTSYPYALTVSVRRTTRLGQVDGLPPSSTAATHRSD